MGFARDVTLIVALAACKGGASAPSPSGSAAKPVTATPADAEPVHVMADIASAVGDAGGTRCTDACRYLTDHALADAPAKFTSECKAAWPYTETDCDAQLYQINCIYASHGYTFKRPEWKTRFANVAWYHARADFKESELSAMEIASIHELKQRQKACGGAALGPVTAADRALVKKAFEDLNSSGDDRAKNLYVFEKTELRYTENTVERRTIAVEKLYFAVDAGKYVDSPTFELTFNAADQLLEIY